MLQRGRRSSRRRSSDVGPSHSVHCSLQRGRRSSRRRSSPVERRRQPITRFNEAAVLHGGGPRAAKRAECTGWCFNEAAVLHGGGLRSSRCATRTSSCFNEAAVLHGGGLASDAKGHPASRSLQRGRRSSRRRSAAIDWSTARVQELQRGRRSSRRRSRCAKTARRCSPGFNEAAVLHGGGPGRNAPSRGRWRSLQRGRRSSRRRSSRCLLP